MFTTVLTLRSTSDVCVFLKLVDELVGKWKSFPDAQHTPLCAHLLGLAMKSVTQLALGERFRVDSDVISFRKNHDAVSFSSLNERVVVVLAQGHR